ncbi:MAG: hypothetical protein FWE45_05115 [Firmicutes bacterium]|nr:hypothetical protein [Bacillota bacterium]
MSGKVFIENVEVVLEDKPPVVERSEHVIKSSHYVLKTLIKKEFRSTIHKYNEIENILVSKIKLFNEDYYKIIFSNDRLSKAWTLIETPCTLEIKVTRLSDEMFVITGDNKGDKSVMSQVSFCRIKESTKVEEFTISFTKLNYIFFLNGCIVLSYTDINEEEDKVSGTIATYNFDGKLLKTHYEYLKQNGRVRESGSNLSADEFLGLT